MYPKIGSTISLRLFQMVCLCSYDDATYLVLIGEGKFFSLGLDLTWLDKISSQGVKEFHESLQKLFARLLVFPLVTVAALNG